MNRTNKGFISLTAIIVLSMSVLSFSLVTMASAASYADSVSRKELRIQAGLNVRACLETVNIMLAKDYFLNGVAAIPELGCVARVANDWRGDIAVEASTTLSGVTGYGREQIFDDGNSVKVVSREID